MIYELILHINVVFNGTSELMVRGLGEDGFEEGVGDVVFDDLCNGPLAFHN